VHSPSTTLLAVVLTAILFSSCSPYRTIDKRADKLYHRLLGKWEVNRWVPKAGNQVARPRGLPTGVIVFYPTNRFMYRSVYGRYSGIWKLDVSPGDGYYSSTLYQVDLQFNDNMDKEIGTIRMEIEYIKKRKIKFAQYPGNINIFSR
jgi:hypothetical protein